MKTILTYGTFDLFHIGHLNLLRRLRGLGDRLLVGVSTDEFNEQKGKRCIVPFAQRFEIVSEIKGVYSAFPEESWEQKERDIVRYGVDVFAIGDDWRGKFDHLRSLCDVRYMERTPGVSSTEIRGALADFVAEPNERMDVAIDILGRMKKDLE